MLKKLFITAALLLNTYTAFSSEQKTCFFERKSARIEDQNTDLAQILHIKKFNDITESYNNHMNNIKKMVYCGQYGEREEIEFNDKISATKQTITDLNSLLVRLQFQTELCSEYGANPLAKENTAYITLVKHLKEIINQLSSSLDRPASLLALQSDSAQIEGAIQCLSDYLETILTKKDLITNLNVHFDYYLLTNQRPPSLWEIDGPLKEIQQEVDRNHPQEDRLKKQIFQLRKKLESHMDRTNKKDYSK